MPYRELSGAPDPGSERVDVSGDDAREKFAALAAKPGTWRASPSPEPSCGTRTAT